MCLQHSSSRCLSCHQHCVLVHCDLGMRRNQNFNLWNFFRLSFSFFSLLFCCSDWPSNGLAYSSKSSEKASLRRAIFSMEQPGVVAGNFALCMAPLGRSLWSGHHWKDLFLLQKLSIDDANFGQKWWRQKRKKGQGSSQAVTGGTGVNGLIHFQFTVFLWKVSQMCYFKFPVNETVVVIKQSIIVLSVE